MPVKETIVCVLRGMGIAVSIGYLFYGKLWYGLLFMALLPIYYRQCKRNYEKRMQKLTLSQFKDGMVALNSALYAGYSVENAFRKAVEELKNLYGNKGTVVRGFYEIVHRLELNGNVEEALEQFARGIGLEDAIYFAEVFRYAKKSGGDLTSIIRKTTDNINGKIEVKKEIEVMITGKQMEQRVMNVIPFVILGYIRMTASEFVAPLYGNLTGVIIMTVCLVVYVCAVKWAEKIVNIEV